MKNAPITVQRKQTGFKKRIAFENVYNHHYIFTISVYPYSCGISIFYAHFLNMKVIYMLEMSD